MTSPSPPLGSYAWLQQTGGRLSPADKRALTGAIFTSLGAFFLDRARLRLGTSPSHGKTADALWPSGTPDSALCRQAEEAAGDLQSPWMLGHARRTWVFAHALAEIDGAAPDPELLYVGALLHDVGLEQPGAEVCFTHGSASAAWEVAAEAELPSARRGALADGIGMHITPGLSAEDSLLGFYLQAGAMADLSGLRRWELPRELRLRALAEHPEGTVRTKLPPCWRQDARAVPDGRAALIERWALFSRVVGQGLTRS